MGADMFAVCGGVQLEPLQVMNEILMLTFASLGSVRRKRWVNATRPAHHCRSQPKASSCAVTGAGANPVEPVRVMPREPVKSSDVALGPPSGMLMPYRWNPSGIMARTVTVPSVGDVIRTDVRHFTGWEAAAPITTAMTATSAMRYFFIK